MAHAQKNKVHEERQPRQHGAIWRFWWALAAVAIIGVPLGYGVGYHGRSTLGGFLTSILVSPFRLGWITLLILVVAIAFWAWFTTYVIDRRKPKKLHWWSRLRRNTADDGSDEDDILAPTGDSDDDTMQQLLIIKSMMGNTAGKAYEAHWNAGVTAKFLGLKLETTAAFAGAKQEDARKAGYAYATEVIEEAQS